MFFKLPGKLIKANQGPTVSKTVNITRKMFLFYKIKIEE